MFRLIKKIKDNGRWRIFKLKLIDARLYFVSIFVGLLTGLVAVPYHYLLQFFFNLRHDFFDSHPKWYWYIPLFLLMWGILVFVSWLVKKMPPTSSRSAIGTKTGARHRPRIPYRM